MLPNDIFPENFMKINLEMAETFTNRTMAEIDNNNKRFSCEQ